MYRVLEVNVDDTGYGGVFSLVKGVIAQKQQGECIDIAAIEKFENQSNIDDLNKKSTSSRLLDNIKNKHKPAPTELELYIYERNSYLCEIMFWG